MKSLKLDRKDIEYYAPEMLSDDLSETDTCIMLKAINLKMGEGKDAVMERFEISDETDVELVFEIC